MSDRRIDQITMAFECYPELSATRVDFRQIAYWCAVGIPPHGMPDGVEVDRAAEAAAEATVARLYQPNPPRGEKIARYLVVIFRAIATGKQALPETDTLSRLGSRLELEEMRKTIAEADARREADAKRAKPDAALPRAALTRLRPRPDVESWPLGDGPVRRVLPARQREYEVERCEPIGDLVPVDFVRESRDVVKENEAHTAAVIADAAAKRKAVGQ